MFRRQHRKTIVAFPNDLFRVNFYRAKPETFGTHYLLRIGSAKHNMWLAGYTISKGMRLGYSEDLIKEGKTVGQRRRESVRSLRFTIPSAESAGDSRKKARLDNLKFSFSHSSK